MSLNDKTPVFSRPHNVGKQVQMLVDMGYTRISATQAADGAFDIEGSGRKGKPIKELLAEDKRLRDALPELKHLRNVMMVPEVKNALQIIIEGVERYEEA